jgi:hypothetical protein
MQHCLTLFKINNQLMTSKASNKKQNREISEDRLIEPTTSAAKKSGLSIFESTITDFWKKYAQTPVKVKLIDSFILYLISLIVWQMFYRIVAGTDFPKNAFLSGIFAPLGVIVMTVALRMHAVGEDGKMLRLNQIYRALWEYLAGLVVLFVVTINFIG